MQRQILWSLLNKVSHDVDGCNTVSKIYYDNDKWSLSTFTLLAVSQPLADDSSAWACALETNTEVGPIFHVTPVASDSVIVCGSNSK